MRVLHVDPERAWGGGEVQVVGLVRELAVRGHDSTVAAHPGGPLARAAAAAGARVVPLGVANHFDRRDHVLHSPHQDDHITHTAAPDPDRLSDDQFVTAEGVYASVLVKGSQGLPVEVAGKVQILLRWRVDRLKLTVEHGHLRFRAEGTRSYEQLCSIPFPAWREVRCAPALKTFGCAQSFRSTCRPSAGS